MPPVMFAHEHDPETPDCSECREPVGVMQDATLLLSGQFFYNTEEQCAMFILDPDTDIAVVEILNGLGHGRPQLAVVLNKDNLGPMRIVHEQCLGDYEPDTTDDDEDEDDEDDDEIDIGLDPDDPDYSAMKMAIARDRGEWDEHDVLNRGRR